MTQFGNNLLYLRKKTKMSQRDLSTRLDRTQKTITNWERGDTEPNISQLIHLSMVFNVSIDDLIKKDLEHNRKTLTYPCEVQSLIPN